MSKPSISTGNIQFGTARAQDLGAILAKLNVFGPRTLGWSAQANRSAPQNVKGKRGVICFMNIPGFSGQGHIDLWNAQFPVGSAYWDSQTIWFWEMNP